MFFVFILLQIILVFFLALHDWIHIPPFTDLNALKKAHSWKERLITSFINTMFVLVPLLITIQCKGTFSLLGISIVIVSYLLLTVGTICAWWIPYLFGSSQKHKQGFIEYKNTHRFLPARGDNVIPNTLHVIMHVLIWVCFAVAIFYLYNF